MKLKGKVTILAILALATIFTLTSCDLAGTLELDESRTSRVVLDNGNELATLFAGQTIAAGTVEISNDADTLYITYTASGDWFLSETHLAVATSLNGIPRTKNGSPVPGQFAINESHVPTVKTVTYELPLEWAVGTTLYIGAHAVVEKYDANGQIVQQETGWSFGPRFVSKGNWATYTTYVVKQYVAPPVDEERTSETAWARLTNGFNDFLNPARPLGPGSPMDSTIS
jgi:predicted small lipoprotein YifL